MEKIKKMEKLILTNEEVIILKKALYDAYLSGKVDANISYGIRESQEHKIYSLDKVFKKYCEIKKSKA
jgi:hypothetical protein